MAATTSALVPSLYPQERAAKPQTVLVTGAGGYLAANLQKRLLAAGHTVHGTVRDVAKAKAELSVLPGANERLKLFKADLLKPDGFKEAMQGCTVVFHTASPYITNAGYGEQAQKRLVEPAVKGTENVLNAVNEVETVKRVVMTSSCASVAHSYLDKPTGYVHTEADWNTTSSLYAQPYNYSKTMAERKTWEIAGKQSRWDLVVINPPIIHGPPAIARGDGESVDMFNKIIKGEFSLACPVLGFAHVDVRDVAALHCVAAFDPKAHGRNIATNNIHTMADIVGFASELYPKQVGKPKFTAPRWLVVLLGPLLGAPRDVMSANAGGTAYFSGEKAISELGVSYIPIKQSLKDMGEALEGFKLIPPIRK